MWKNAYEIYSQAAVESNCGEGDGSWTMLEMLLAVLLRPLE